MSIWQWVLIIAGAVLAYILLGRMTYTAAKMVDSNQDDLFSVSAFWWVLWIIVIVVAAVELFVKLFTKVLFPAVDWCGRGLGWLFKKLD